MTRDELIDIKAGDGIQFQWSPPRWTRRYEVLEIYARDVDRSGKLFVCGKVRFSEHSTMTFSAKEGDTTVRMVQDA